VDRYQAGNGGSYYTDRNQVTRCGWHANGEVRAVDRCRQKAGASVIFSVTVAFRFPMIGKGHTLSFI